MPRAVKPIGANANASAIGPPNASASQRQQSKFRVKVVRTYQTYRQQLSERQVATRTLAQ